MLGVALRAAGHGAYPPGLWVVGPPQPGVAAGSRRRQQPCAWLLAGQWRLVGCRARSMDVRYRDQACLSCSGSVFRGPGKPLSPYSAGVGGRCGMVS